MHPATRLLMKLGPAVDDADDWRFIVCVLKLLVEFDPRPQMHPNVVQDIYNRIEEAGVAPNAQAYILMRERLSGLYNFYASC